MRRRRVTQRRYTSTLTSRSAWFAPATSDAVIRRAQSQEAAAIHGVTNRAFKDMVGWGYSQRAIETVILDPEATALLRSLGYEP